MAQINNLRVEDTQSLRTEAKNFENHATEIKKVTDAMITRVNDTSNVWRGEDQAEFAKKFNDLQTSMNYLYKLITTYTSNLNDIAGKYDTAVENAKGKASALTTEIPMMA